MKKYIIGFIFGIVISSTVVFAANYLYQADEVSYTPSDKDWKVDNVDDAIKELYTMINSSNEALTNLKNTDIAKAVGANGNDFASVINKLGTIVNQGNKSFTVNGTNAITIPAGYYNGQGTISTSGLIPIPTATKSITANGTYDVTDYASVSVNASGKIDILGVGGFDVTTTRAYNYIVLGAWATSADISGGTRIHTTTNNFFKVRINSNCPAGSRVYASDAYSTAVGVY